MYVLEPHTGIFSGLTGCGKTHKMLDLLENEYKGHFEYIVILCPTLRYNKTYLARSWIKEDDRVFLIEPGGKLLEWLKQLSKLFSGKNVLFIVDDMIADETLDKTRGALLDIAISGRHREHSLWMLTQRYKKIPITVRDQLKQLFVWFPKNRHELELIIAENDVGDVDVGYIKKQLKNEKHACFYLRLEHPRTFQVLTSIIKDDYEIRP